jgi:hypothetical protein
MLILKNAPKNNIDLRSSFGGRRVGIFLEFTEELQFTMAIIVCLRRRFTGGWKVSKESYRCLMCVQQPVILISLLPDGQGGLASL